MRAPFLITSVVLHALAIGVTAVVVHGGGREREPASVQILASEEVPPAPPEPERAVPLHTEPVVEPELPPVDVTPVLTVVEPQVPDAWAPAPLPAAAMPTHDRITVSAPPPVAEPPADAEPPVVPPPVPPSARVDAMPLDDRNEPPEYPTLARQLGQQGTVRIRVRLDERGDVIDAEIAEACAFADLNRSALRAVRKWKFAPAREGGVAVADSLVVPVVFRLTDR